MESSNGTEWDWDRIWKIRAGQAPAMGRPSQQTGVGVRNITSTVAGHAGGRRGRLPPLALSLEEADLPLLEGRLQPWAGPASKRG